MQAELKISMPILNRLIADWKDEHSRYYGLPCGHIRIPLDCIEPGLPCINDVDHIACGCWSDGENTFWMRSSGSWLYAKPKEEILIVSGARHSIRERLSEYVRKGCSSWKYISSQRPDLAPWETTT